jgi:hypothetical protein
MEIGGTVDFKEHVGGNEGYVSIWVIYPNGTRSRAGYKYFEGIDPISWTWQDITNATPDAGAWGQGEYTLQFYAVAANGAQKLIEQTITIDNTPELSKITRHDQHDDEYNKDLFDLSTTVTFKEYVGGFEGTVQVFVNGSYQGAKIYEGKSHTVKYSEITGHLLDATAWLANESTITFKAIAHNGARATKTWRIAGRDENLGPPHQCP